MLTSDDEKKVSKQNARFVHADIARRNKENAENFANEQKAFSSEFWCEICISLTGYEAVPVHACWEIHWPK